MILTLVRTLWMVALHAGHHTAKFGGHRHGGSVVCFSDLGARFPMLAEIRHYHCF